MSGVFAENDTEQSSEEATINAIFDKARSNVGDNDIVADDIPTPDDIEAQQADIEDADSSQEADTETAENSPQEADANAEVETAPDEGDGQEEQKSVTPSWDDEVILPDGSKATWKQLHDERLMHSDYTRKTTEVANLKAQVELERAKIAELYKELQEKENAFKEDVGVLSKINEIRRNNPEARDELAAFLESHGEKELAEEAKKDPTIMDLQKRLEAIEAEKKELERKAQSEKVWADFEKAFNKAKNEKYKYADYKEVKAAIIAGEFQFLEDAMKYSHDKVQEALTKHAAENVKKISEVKKKIPPVPARGKTSAPTKTELEMEQFSGSIFDPEWNKKMSQKLRSVKKILTI